MREALEFIDELESCGELFGKPPPKTRLKNPGFSFGVAIGEEATAEALRVATVGDGAGGSGYRGMAARSRMLLALTNSWAWSLMLGSG